MSDKWIPLVSRQESPLWVSLVCLGGREKWFRKSISWDYSINKYKYEEFSHCMSTEDGVELQKVIEEKIDDSLSYRRYLDRCESASRNLEQTAASVSTSFSRIDDPSNDRIRSLLEKFFDSVLQAMPFMASLVLVQDRLETDLRNKISATINEEPNSAEVDKVMEKCLVPAKSNSVVEESRNIQKLASQLRRREVSAEKLGNSVEEAISHASEKWPSFEDELNKHIEEYGWIKTFTYLNEPYTKREILKRIIAALKSIESSEKYESIKARSNRKLRISDNTIDELFEDSDDASLFRLAREYLYWRFERVDVHFRSEAYIRNLEKAVSKRAGVSRAQLVHCTYPEIMDWLDDVSALPT